MRYVPLLSPFPALVVAFLRCACAPFSRLFFTEHALPCQRFLFIGVCRRTTTSFAVWLFAVLRTHSCVGYGLLRHFLRLDARSGTPLVRFLPERGAGCSCLPSQRQRFVFGLVYIYQRIPPLV